MYPGLVKTIAVTIPEELDGRAAAEARRQGVSKSELIRRGLLAVLPESPAATDDDAWTSLAGFGSDNLSVGPGEVDEIVYGS
jgi:Ribbon-helix-helix protein, copG family